MLVRFGMRHGRGVALASGFDTPLWVHAAAVGICVATCLDWQMAKAGPLSTRRAVDAYARAPRPLDRTASALMAGFGVRLLWVFD
jgi:threonine/homoserine/homoserine lactone efflux protein